MSVLWTDIHRGIRLIFFFITRFCPLPAYHGVTLRTHKGSSLFRKTEAGCLTVHNKASPFALAGQRIAESNVIIAHTEDYVHLLPFCIGKSTYQFIGLIVYLGSFDTRLRVNSINFPFFMPGQFHCFREISHIGLQTQRRWFQHLFSVISERIRCFLPFRARNC